MREQPGAGRLDDEKPRCAVHSQPAEEYRVDRQARGQSAINARCTARTVIIRVKRDMSSVRGFARRLVTGWQGARRTGRLCDGNRCQLTTRLRQRTIGRAGDGKGKNDKTGEERTHSRLVPAFDGAWPVTTR